ncbi:hypothetical protein [Burkholderia sp. S-53]|uniref:hypothetical protein n=1 Tax=Burkholderia sp. S-53 TaxID=2906514 RepID=UPI0021CFCFE2|nr:hypothetical protein [Burkholderia sp. S-53]UXU89664.1 hypothetical protein LXM88_30425 [Burkholderia sp. S-53]
MAASLQGCDHPYIVGDACTETSVRQGFCPSGKRIGTSLARRSMDAASFTSVPANFPVRQTKEGRRLVGFCRLLASSLAADAQDLRGNSERGAIASPAGTRVVTNP